MRQCGPVDSERRETDTVDVAAAIDERVQLSVYVLQRVVSCSMLAVNDQFRDTRCAAAAGDWTRTLGAGRSDAYCERE